MISQFNLIPANDSHVSFLSTFGKKSFVDAYKITLPEEELEDYVDIAFSREQIEHEIEKSNAFYFLCDHKKDGLCGYVKFICSKIPECVSSDNAIELKRLYVMDKYKGAGVGSLLSGCGESICQEHGFTALWLRVWDGNIAAQKIYLHWGYKFCGEETYEVGREKRRVLLMVKQIY
ncbi:GNAT superfamily N-acetyltransferase [Methanohalophilus levihalophilus]|uniref:GNAT family N-acetyltransferase n=1 Tax=Methanohalophilus levihalophilus TaxID=1431282 RepID=UPI001AE54406|nr:GNAT family N-acetyltransferase [Methanohalophilus levihalophilus]MBP2031069.1 GNAT superfamily N-acetyltransferase [Methanohalophilus levihalophilus]